MGAIKLQSFHSEGALDRYDQGFADGLRAGQESAHLVAEHATREAVEDLTSTLEDLAFKSAELRHILMEDFNRLVARIADQLLPELLDPLCAAQIFTVVLDAGTEAKRAPVQVAVGPQFDDELIAFLNASAPGISIVRSSDNGPGDALVSTKPSEVFVDSADIVSRLIDALSVFSDTATSQVSA